VAVHIVSDPKGADVVIAGEKVGVTPFDRKIKRGTAVLTLAVRLEGYAEFTSKIDTGGEYSNDHIKLVKVEAEKPDEPTKEPEPIKPPEPDKIKPESDKTKTPPHPPAHPTGHVTHPSPTHTQTTPTHTQTQPTPPPAPPPAPPKPKCQPAAQMNPYDTSCDGKACPPCK
jgi:PEGA domain-containing protein